MYYLRSQIAFIKKILTIHKVWTYFGCFVLQLVRNLISYMNNIFYKKSQIGYGSSSKNSIYESICYTFYNKSYTQSYQNSVLTAFICSYLLQISFVRRPLTWIGLKPTILIFFILLNLIAFLWCVIMWDVDHWNNTMQWVVR